MEMLQLRYFYESALSESFSKTAQKFMVPTASVSASVKRLEKELGTELFDRTSNRIILNDKGRLFLQSVSQIFYELENASLSIHDKEKDERKLKILAHGVRQKITKSILDYRTAHPMQAFKLRLDFEDENYDDYNIVVSAKNDILPDWEKFMLCSHRVRIEASKYTPLCQKSLTLKQLANQPFVTTGKKNELYKILIRACKRKGFEPNFIMECNDYDCIDIVERAGMGLGLTLDSGSATFGMQYLDVTDFNETYSIYVYYKNQDYYGNVRTFIDHLKATVK